MVQGTSTPHCRTCVGSLYGLLGSSAISNPDGSMYCVAPPPWVQNGDVQECDKWSERGYERIVRVRLHVVERYSRPDRHACSPSRRCTHPRTHPHATPYPPRQSHLHFIGAPVGEGRSEVRALTADTAPVILRGRAGGNSLPRGGLAPVGGGGGGGVSE